jgi:hypothetical protein
MDLGYETVLFADCDIAFIADFSQYLVSASAVYAAGVQSDALPRFPPKRRVLRRMGLWHAA